MNHHFKQLNKLLVDNVSHLDTKTISKANELIGAIYRTTLENRSEGLKIRFSNKSYTESIYLMCLELFGKYEYLFKYLTYDFLEWLIIHVIDIDKPLYYNAEYDNFIYTVRRKPNNFAELEKFCTLSHEIRMKIVIDKYKK